jgi:hypothetical protein
MRLTTKWQVIIGTFTMCWMLYFLVPCTGQGACFAKMSDLFESDAFNLAFLMVLFLTVSLLSADAAEAVYFRARRLPWFRPRLGEVLHAQGFISRDELEDALNEQKLRIGEVLLKAGRVSEPELSHAIDYHRSHAGVRVGEALIALGYASKTEIAWALDRSNRKLGKILVDRGRITEQELHRILGRIWYGRNHGL